MDGGVPQRRTAERNHECPPGGHTDGLAGAGPWDTVALLSAGVAPSEPVSGQALGMVLLSGRLTDERNAGSSAGAEVVTALRAREGGMGSPWRAEHIELATPAAVKLIDPAIAQSSDALVRFKREAQAAAFLRSTAHRKNVRRFRSAAKVGHRASRGV